MQAVGQTAGTVYFVCVCVAGGRLEDKHLFQFGRMPLTLAFRLFVHGWSLISLPIY